MLVGKDLEVTLGWWHKPGLERQMGVGEVKEVEIVCTLKKSKSSLKIFGSGPEFSSTLLLLFLSEFSSSWHLLLFLSGKYSTASSFRFWDMVVALKERMDMLSMLAPKEVREGMGRAATREDRSTNW